MCAFYVVPLDLAGYNSVVFPGHSFRRGGATFAFAGEVPGELIQLHGDWASDAYLRYLDVSLHCRWQVGLKIKELIYAQVS